MSPTSRNRRPNRSPYGRNLSLAGSRLPASQSRPSRSSVSRSHKASRSHTKNLSLVGSRSHKNTTLSKYSRLTTSSTYAKQRRQRARRKQVLVGSFITALALLVAGVATAFAIILNINDELHKNVNFASLEGRIKERGAPEDPFWMLLLGTDYPEYGFSRADTIILAYINPGQKTAALVSIPRDTRVYLSEYGWWDKINAAYAYGELDYMEGSTNRSGPAAAIAAVTELAGISVAGYVQVDINGLAAVVDALGGVWVDVPVSIIGDREAGNVDVYEGAQWLDGDHALVFVRSRQYIIGDYQRQANQRTFLQAVARQVLSADRLTVINTVSKVCDMTTTNFSVTDIAQIASSMRGMEESDIYTYSIPCTSELIQVGADLIWFEVPDMEATRALFAAINSGVFPDSEEWGLTRQGETPVTYKPKTGNPATEKPEQGNSTINASEYTIDVRNGYGIAGCATAVSDMLAIAGYIQGEIANANTWVYTETLIIYRDYRDAGQLAVANDIQARLGYGRIIPSYDRYLFEGDILVIVGGDFPD